MEYPAAGATTMGGEDHEEDDEYEDVFVVLELPDLPDAFLEDCKTYQLIGVDTETPMLRLGSSVFKGSFQDVLGTNLIFSEHTRTRTHTHTHTHTHTRTTTQP
jgi:hypothetical protein